MDAVLASLVAVTGTLIAAFGGFVAQARISRKDQLRTTAAQFAHQLSVHRGDLYDRWELARQENPDPQEQQAANRTSNNSRREVNLALYTLRVLTRNAGLLRLADEAVTATYAVKPRGEDLSTVTPAAMSARHARGTAADNAFLNAAAGL